jgi:hypothetical protein
MEGVIFFGCGYAALWSLCPLWLKSLSSFLEESAQNLPAFFEENARLHFQPMVQAFILQQGVKRSDCAGLGILYAEN